jgi:hypothetical protein
MTKGKPRPEFPDRKISETFLHFAEPLLEPLGPHATEEQENQALQIAFTVWNAVVYESAIGDRRFMTTLRNSTGSQPEVAALVAYMISRKQALFGDDHRLVGEFKFVHREGERRLRVEARSPYRTDSAHPVPQPSTDSASGSNVNRAH